MISWSPTNAKDWPCGFGALTPPTVGRASKGQSRPVASPKMAFSTWTGVRSYG